VAIAQLLIERGADPTAVNSEGKTLLHIASQEGHVAIANLLIDRRPSAATARTYCTSPHKKGTWP
jgi:ankyrin repeat protein